MNLLLAIALFALGYARGVTDGVRHEQKKQRKDFTV